MSRREKLIYVAAGGLLLAFVLTGVAWRIVSRGDVDNALAVVPEGYTIVQVDLGAAWDRHVDESEGNPSPSFAILPEDVERGDPALVLGGWVDADERAMAVRFEGYWDEVTGYPMVLRQDALSVPRSVDYLEGTPFVTEVQAVGDIEDADVITYVLGPPPSE